MSINFRGVAAGRRAQAKLGSCNLVDVSRVSGCIADLLCFFHAICFSWWVVTFIAAVVS